MKNLLLILLLFLISCQKKIWQDDVEAQLTYFTHKTWKRYDTISCKWLSRTYYYNDEKSFTDDSGDRGLWLISSNGVMKETLFKKNGNTLLTTYQLITVTDKTFKRKEKGIDNSETFIY